MMTSGDSQQWDSRAFEAKYAGYCNAECGERIEPGDKVMYVGTLLVHEACAVAAPPSSSAGQGPSGPTQSSYDKPTKYAGTSLEDMGY